MFLQPSDFTVGIYLIATDCYDEANLQYYIDRFEKEYLQKLLGCELYQLFVDDLNGDTPPAPTSQRFIDIYEEFCEDSDFANIVVRGYGKFYEDDCAGCGKIWISKGMLDMLQGFIFFHYVRDQKYLNTPVGDVVNRNEVSREANGGELMFGVTERFNAAVESYQAIQYRICDNLGDYPEYKGVCMEKLGLGGAL